ncbi:MAG: Na(+)/H(+) antiporter NhaA [Nitrospirae bacterium]|nr:Na(+)/H(+) antiporter NhaA [Nitrospirota bacterium]
MIRPVLKPFETFVHAESSGGILLLGATLVAMVWANSPWADSYARLWSTPVSLVVGSHALTETLLEWINDGLMAMFFFVIGLEIKREVLVGELASWRRAALPLAAALGGTVVPASLYLLVNGAGPGAPGWGIPMATDIAFALGVLALLGPRVPLSLKVFLTALAIGDDLMAVLVIALFYTSTISWLNVGIGALFLLLLVAANFVGIRHLLVYSVLGIGGLWLAFLLSGVHATIAGVLAAMTIPARTRLSGSEFVARGQALLKRFEEVTSAERPPLANTERHHVTQRLEMEVKDVETPLQRLEHALHPWVTVVVMPLFALANAGITLDANGWAHLTHPVALGIMVGLFIGKPVGILLASWGASQAGLVSLPEGVTWRQLAGTGVLAGIGFTMSLFIAGLAFPPGPLQLSAKVGILCASTSAGIVGWAWLRSGSGGAAVGKAARQGGKGW